MRRTIEATFRNKGRFFVVGGPTRGAYPNIGIDNQPGVASASVWLG